MKWADQCAGGLPEDSLTPAERRLLSVARNLGSTNLPRETGDLCRSDDGLVALLKQLRTSEKQRDIGQFFTPPAIVRAMVDWVRRREPVQVVDAGCGTGRFAIEAAQALPEARIIAIDSDPVATLLCRARVKRAGLTNVEVRCGDFLHDDLRLEPGSAAFLGNPPYVRHHRLSPETKGWVASASRKLGVPFSKLAGLHVYFFLATALHGRRGDIGCYLTSAEWLDVCYGRGLRMVLTRDLGLRSVCVLDESVVAFDDAMTSAAITCFELGCRTSEVRFSLVREFREAEGPPEARIVPRGELHGRWGPLLRGTRGAKASGGLVRLGDLAAVHRGIATGANRFFVMPRSEADALGLTDFAKPAITAGRQILDSGGRVRAEPCKVVILLPKNLEGLPATQREAVERYLAEGRQMGIPDRYLCRHRSPWWWLGEPQAPPIVASYMARRPPAFALNPDRVHILNIAHGLYPRRSMDRGELDELAGSLNRRSQDFVGSGRRYQGGLEKFEPREMEELLVPAISGIHREGSDDPT